MAALDFPTATTDGQIFKADNGVWYTWVAAGSYWSGSLGTAIGNLEGYYVNKTGDKMFGNLTLGTEGTTSIVLNATSGAATFDGRLTLNGTGAGTAAYIGNNGEVQITYQGNITTDGSITAAGYGLFNDDVISSIGNEFQHYMGRKSDKSLNGLSLYIASNSDGALNPTMFECKTRPGGVDNVVASIKADGSATFAGGKALITSGGSYLADSEGNAAGNAAVTINSNGSASFAGGVNIASALGDDKRFSISGNTGNVYVGQSSSLTTAGVVLSPNGSGSFAGNVGIGTPSPTRPLTVSSPTGSTNILGVFDNSAGAAGNCVIAFSDPTSTAGQFSTRLGCEGDSLAFYTDGPNERMRIDKSGRLLVGTDTSKESTSYMQNISPSDSTIFIASSNISATGQAKINLGPANSITGAQIICGADEDFSTGANRTAHLKFNIRKDGALNERLRIDSSGSLNINQSNYQPLGSTYFGGYLSLTHTGSRNGMYITCTETEKTCYSLLVSNPGAEGQRLISFQKYDGSSNPIVGSITHDGTSTSYNESSDYRLKENIVDITDGITRLKQLQPRRFNFIADAEKTVDGFIAHEAQVVVPQAVTGTKDEVDDDGNAVIQSIDKSKLVPLLTAALQETIAKIETLEQRLSDAGL